MHNGRLWGRGKREIRDGVREPCVRRGPDVQGAYRVPGTPEFRTRGLF